MNAATTATGAHDPIPDTPIPDTPVSETAVSETPAPDTPAPDTPLTEPPPSGSRTGAGAGPASTGHRIGIRGAGSYLPDRIRGNREVAEATGVTEQWIVERTGVRARHTASPDQAASDLAAAAVRAALAAAGLDAADLGLLVCASSTPDELGPSTACRVQHLTGAVHAVALDVSAACSGWLFAVKVAHDWLRADGGGRYAAVVGVEAYSKFLDTTDRGTSVLFADGAAATVLGPVPDGHGFTDFDLGSDGSLAGSVLIPGGGSRRPASARTLADGSHRIHMDGRVVSRFIRDTFPRLVREALARNRLTLDDIDCVIAHQPNPVLLHGLGRGMGIPEDKLVIVGDEVGNIGAASAPYALTTAAARGALRPGDRVLVVVFGAGMTWGSALLTWSGGSAIRIRPAADAHAVAAPRDGTGGADRPAAPHARPAGYVPTAPAGPDPARVPAARRPPAPARVPGAATAPAHAAGPPHATGPFRPGAPALAQAPAVPLPSSLLGAVAPPPPTTTFASTSTTSTTSTTFGPTAPGTENSRT